MRPSWSISCIQNEVGPIPDAAFLMETAGLAMDNNVKVFTMNQICILLLTVGAFVSPYGEVKRLHAQDSDGHPLSNKLVQRIDSLNGRRVDRCLYWQHGDAFVYMSFLYRISAARKNGDKFLVQNLNIDSPGWICDGGESLIVGVGRDGTADSLFAPRNAKIQVFDQSLAASKIIEIPNSNQDIDYVSCVRSDNDSMVLFCSTSKLRKSGDDHILTFEQQLILVKDNEATVIHRSQPFISVDGFSPVFARSGDDILAVGLKPDPIVFRAVGKHLDLRYDDRWFNGVNGLIDLAPIKSPRSGSGSSDSLKVAFISDDRLWIFDPVGDRVEDYNVSNMSPSTDVALYENGKRFLLSGNGIVVLPVEMLSVSRPQHPMRINPTSTYHRCAVNPNGQVALCGTVDGFLDIVQIP